MLTEYGEVDSPQLASQPALFAPRLHLRALGAKVYTTYEYRIHKNASRSEFGAQSEILAHAPAQHVQGRGLTNYCSSSRRRSPTYP